jgi:hypothetical protein
MASGDRFYQLELRHRPALYGDIGSLLKVEGLLVGGEGAQGIFLLPGTDAYRLMPLNDLMPIRMLSVEEWTDFLQRSDNPEILVMPAKAFHRKVRYEISGAVQQKVWMADGLKCVYCGRRMGLVQLTIDHFIPLEIGGKNDTSNYLSCCRRCNKDKGATDPRDWCALEGLDYEFFVDYLKARKIA